MRKIDERITTIEGQLQGVGRALRELQLHTIESITGRTGIAELHAHNERVFVGDQLKPATRADVKTAAEAVSRELHKLIDQTTRDGQIVDHLRQTVREDRDRWLKLEKELSDVKRHCQERWDYQWPINKKVAEDLARLTTCRTVWQRLRWVLTGNF